MTLLSDYRRQLIEIGAGRSRRFSSILRAFRVLWLLCVGIGLALAAWFIGSEFVHATEHGGGWGLLIGPVMALAFAVVGYVPYGIAQLFLSPGVRTHG